jgi:hypothetical protein
MIRVDNAQKPYSVVRAYFRGLQGFSKSPANDMKDVCLTILSRPSAQSARPKPPRPNSTFNTKNHARHAGEAGLAAISASFPTFDEAARMPLMMRFRQLATGLRALKRSCS